MVNIGCLPNLRNINVVHCSGMLFVMLQIVIVLAVPHEAYKTYDLSLKIRYNVKMSIKQ